MNICDYIIKKKIPHKVLPDCRIMQVGSLNLTGRGITCLNGFIQNDDLYLMDNKILRFGNFVLNKHYCTFGLLNTGIYYATIGNTNTRNIRCDIYYSAKSGELLIRNLAWANFKFDVSRKLKWHKF
jgi:hypothetical protein